MSKRLEIYIGFKCNNDCIFCVEHARRQHFQAEQILQTEAEIRTAYADYKKQGYDHLNILGGEPFVQPNIGLILKLAKDYGFSVAVTNNASMLGQEKISQEYLPLIDDLVLSIHGHTEELVTKQSNNPSLWQQMLQGLNNVRQYFRGRLVKTNTVINSLNYQDLPEIVKFISDFGIKELSLTSMSIDSHNQPYIVKYQDLAPYLQQAIKYGQEHDLNIRLAEIPFCFLGDYYHLANHLYFDQRLKFDVNGQEVVWDRPKIKSAVCTDCLLKDLCQGLDKEYYNLYGDKELKPVKNL